MIIRSSHLALRFYQRDGWTEDLVKSYVNGPIVAKDFDSIGGFLAYWIPEVGTMVDAEKLIQDGHAAETWKNEVLDKEESLKYFKEMSW